MNTAAPDEPLRQQLEFDDHDLECNRDGRLSAAQAARIVRRENRREQRLMLFAIATAVVGFVLLFFEPTLGMLALAVVGVVLGIRAINRIRSGGIAEGARVETVTGPIELHRVTKTSGGQGFDYRIWAGVQYAPTDKGREMSSATKVFTVDKSLWDLLEHGADYAIHYFRGKPVSIEYRAPPVSGQTQP